MLLAFDIGNTSVSFGLFDISGDETKLVVSSRVALRKNACADEYSVLIKDILRLKLGGDDPVIDSSAISCVVPSALTAVSDAAEILSDRPPYIICPGVKTGFRISIYDPACLGADIVSNAAAALLTVEPPLVIFDAGTANTITVIDGSGTLIGTVITPGLRISAAALHEHAELLESVPIDGGKLPLIGRDTDESVRSGIVYGSAVMLDGYVRNIRETVVKTSDRPEAKLGLVATGEFGRLITDHCRNKFVYDASLTIKGIAALYRKNTK